MKEGFDVGLEMSGNPAAFRDMLANMCHGGKIAMLGIPTGEMAIDWNTVIFNMLTIKGIYGREMYETWYKMTVMIQSGLDIDPVITHRFHYTEFERASRSMRSGNSGKVVLDVEGGAVTPMLRLACKSTWPTQLRRRSATPGLLQGRAGASPRRSGARIGVLEREPRCSTSAPTTTSAWPTIPRSIAAAHEALDRWGYGLASVRFICGTQELHKQLEAAAQRVPGHRGHDPLLLLLRRQRRAVRDAARRRGRGHLRRAEPRQHHRRRPAVQGPAVPLPQQRHGRPRSPARSEAADARFRLIATDGVFSMDGIIANLPGICDLADSYDAAGDGRRLARRRLHGPHGRGTPEYHGVMGRVDILTGTLGKALGGASGGYTSGPPRDHRPAAPAEPAVPVLQHRRPADRRRVAEGARTARPLDRAPRPAGGQHAATSARAWRERGLPHRAGRASDRARSCSATPCWRRRWPKPCSRAAST